MPRSKRSPEYGTVAVAGFGNQAFNNTGFQVTFNGPGVALTNVAPLGLQDFTAGASGFVGETDKGVRWTTTARSR